MCVYRLNSTVECIPYHLQLSPENALQLIQQYPQATSFTCNCHNTSSSSSLLSHVQAYDYFSISMSSIFDMSRKL